jgi:NADH-quinone oxidoreductase subunit A
MSQYLPIFAMLVLATLFGAISRIAQRLLIPPRPTPAKVAPYECGIIPSREPPHRFPVRFYLVAMIFIVFDIEIIFFFPYAVAFRDLGGFGLAAAVIFSVAVFESFVYLISNGALDWGPAKTDRRSEVVSPSRTTTSTIRRVGLEGRAPEPTPEPSRAA